ncbi:MAG: hypothetical protein QOI99_523 [Actinomycetota bacterium]|nr:hypothetical protein [Actinomycetota bacterium]
MAVVGVVAGALVTCSSPDLGTSGRGTTSTNSTPTSTPEPVTSPTTEATSPTTAPATSPGAPLTPPAAICDNAAVLAGPAAPPAGAVRVDPGQDLYAATQAHPPATTFWLAPGTHVLGDDVFAQVQPKDHDVYEGAPGAVLDGRGRNRYAFTGQAQGVVIRHLTVTGFVSPQNEGVVNHDAGRGWTVEANTIRANSAAGLFVGSDNVVRSNCLAANGQYGFSGYRPDGITNVVIDHNEIAGNNTEDWEAHIPGCGCAGGGKLWDTTAATLTANWVHDNHGPGLWADTNNVGFRIEGNLIEGNDAEAIFYEISYNARIVANTLRRNGLVKGRAFAARGDSFPVAAIYLSEAGGDPRLADGTYATLEVAGNLLEDNWGGVVLWENADRFCNSVANTSAGYCTKGGAALPSTCAAGTIERGPYLSDCRWKTMNVSVHDNDFRIDKAALGCVGQPCGLQAVIANYGTFPAWSPYKARVVQEAITFHQNNHFTANRYRGDWHFDAYEPGRILDLAAWQAAPYGQDAGSTLR